MLQERTETRTIWGHYNKALECPGVRIPTYVRSSLQLSLVKRRLTVKLWAAHTQYFEFQQLLAQSSEREERDLSVSHGWGDVGHLIQCKILCPTLDSSQKLESEKRAGEPGWSMDVGRPHGPLLSDGNRIANRNLSCVPRTAQVLLESTPPFCSGHLEQS